MRLNRSPASINWRYAIGEITLIAIGVLIALAASDWQSNRAARNAEISILQQIYASLEQDRGLVLRWCEEIQGKETKLEELLAHLRSRQPYSESLDRLFGSVYGFRSPRLNKAAYESLKSQGMELISDFSLRNQISVAYEKTFEHIEFNFWLSQNTVLELFRPYYLENFSEIRFHRNATPLDYDKILSDVPFRNLLEYRLQQIQGVHISMCESATRDMDMLLKAIATHVE